MGEADEWDYWPFQNVANDISDWELHKSANLIKDGYKMADVNNREMGRRLYRCQQS